MPPCSAIGHCVSLSAVVLMLWCVRDVVFRSSSFFPPVCVFIPVVVPDVCFVTGIVVNNFSSPCIRILIIFS